MTKLIWKSHGVVKEYTWTNTSVKQVSAKEVKRKVLNSLKSELLALRPKNLISNRNGVNNASCIADLVYAVYYDIGKNDAIQQFEVVSI